MGWLEKRIKAKAIEVGYDACGIVDVESFREHEEEIAGRRKLFPHTGPFYDRIREMTEPAEGSGKAKSVIVCLWRYDRYAIPEKLQQHFGKIHLVGGYHYTKNAAIEFQDFMQELGLDPKPGGSPARWAAVKAGLGKFRNNNFIYTERGSWNAIHTWTVDQTMEVEEPPQRTRFACPEGCDRCVKACPTGALSAPMTMDPTRCTAFLTFYHGTGWAKKLRDRMGTWIYGCDACQNACPANSGSWRETDSLHDVRRLEELLTPESLLTMDEETYRAEIHPRFSYIGIDGLWQWRCNAIRAMANEDFAKYETIIAGALDDNDENVREAAVWAMAKKGQ